MWIRVWAQTINFILCPLQKICVWWQIKSIGLFLKTALFQNSVTFQIFHL